MPHTDGAASWRCLIHLESSCVRPKATQTDQVSAAAQPVLAPWHERERWVLGPAGEYRSPGKHDGQTPPQDEKPHHGCSCDSDLRCGGWPDVPCGDAVVGMWL